LAATELVNAACVVEQVLEKEIERQALIGKPHKPHKYQFIEALLVTAKYLRLGDSIISPQWALKTKECFEL
jgi:hypothetical protein